MADDGSPMQAGRLRRFLRRWGGSCVAALALLAASQLLWWWQTWPVRQLVEPPAASTTPAP